MKFSLPDSCKTFFFTHGILELEEVLSSKELTLLLQKMYSKAPWHKDEELKKILFKSKLGEIASILFKKRPVRLASFLFNPSFTQDSSLEQITSATPLLGGAFICLESSQDPLQENLPNLAKQTTGQVTFFSPTHTIPFSALTAQGFKGALLAFIPQKARYTLQPLDPQTHELKRSGYVFGDLILESEAPYLYY